MIAPIFIAVIAGIATGGFFGIMIVKIMENNPGEMAA